MGMVAVSLTVMPAEKADIEHLKQAIRGSMPEGASVRDMQVKPIAFGLKSLEVLLMLPDGAGLDGIEKRIAAIRGVESVEAGDVTLI